MGFLVHENEIQAQPGIGKGLGHAPAVEGGFPAIIAEEILQVAENVRLVLVHAHHLVHGLGADFRPEFPLIEEKDDLLSRKGPERRGEAEHFVLIHQTDVFQFHEILLVAVDLHLESESAARKGVALHVGIGHARIPPDRADQPPQVLDNVSVVAAASLDVLAKNLLHLLGQAFGGFLD